MGWQCLAHCLRMMRIFCGSFQIFEPFVIGSRQWAATRTFFDARIISAFAANPPGPATANVISVFKSSLSLWRWRAPVLVDWKANALIMRASIVANQSQTARRFGKPHRRFEFTSFTNNTPTHERAALRTARTTLVPTASARCSE